MLNPGILSAFPAESHRGLVRFEAPPESERLEGERPESERPERERPESEQLRMTWLVAVRPMRGLAPLVQAFTALIVSSLSRSYCQRLGVEAWRDTGEWSELTPARGQDTLTSSTLAATLRRSCDTSPGAGPARP